jgi:hypothetical protein
VCGANKAQKQLSSTCDRQEHANSSSRPVAPWPTFSVRSNTKKTTMFVVGLRSDCNVKLHPWPDRKPTNYSSFRRITPIPNYLEFLDTKRPRRIVKLLGEPTLASELAEGPWLTTLTTVAARGSLGASQKAILLERPRRAGKCHENGALIATFYV